MRNYSKESAWEKEKYERMQCKIDKELGTKFKEHLKNKETKLSKWMEEKIKEELDMRYYIVDCNGNVLGDFGSLESAQAHLELYSKEEIEKNELEIIEGN